LCLQASVNVQRGRDLGLLPYNEARRRLGLSGEFILVSVATIVCVVGSDLVLAQPLQLLRLTTTVYVLPCWAVSLPHWPLALGFCRA
jgi:hypothetical protein